ncbi:MAG: hypothetical protein Q8L14_02690 [Myxococcales bacterium]|nr:hypothetical protein [Myxococcales bacterium]
MRGMTVKFPEETLAWLKAEANARGRKLGTFLRELVEERRAGSAPSDSVHAMTADLAGSQKGSRASATNDRRKFRR